MKKLKGIVLCALLAATLVPCGAADKKSPAGKDRLVIAYSFHALDVSMSAMWKGIQAFGKKYEADTGVKIKFLMTNADGSTEKQLSDVDSLIVQKPDVIMIRAVDCDGSVPAFKACVKAGIPCVNDLMGANTDIATVKFMAVNNNYLGRMLAIRLEKYLDENPGASLNIGFIDCDPASSTALQRGVGFTDYLTQKFGTKGRAKIIARKYANWSTTEAMAVTEDWLQRYPDINCIVAANDEMGLGAMNVINAAGKKGVLILGIDGIDAARQGIKDGSYFATIVLDVAQIAKYDFDLAVSVAKGESVEKNYDISSKIATLVDSSNIAGYLK